LLIGLFVAAITLPSNRNFYDCPPVPLDCSSVVTLNCGIQLNGHSNAGGSSNVSTYSCAVMDGSGPVLLECMTYRYMGHSLSDTRETYRSKEEVDYWKKRDPIPKMKAIIQHDFEVPDEEFKEIDAQAKQILDDAVAFAEAGSELPVERLYEDAYV
jgi:TPP-dependent pyruvate/acetoin dehydrogenase alpha subunit